MAVVIQVLFRSSRLTRPSITLAPWADAVQSPAELDYRMERICETCAYFCIGTDFLHILIGQRNHASEHGQGRPGYSRPARVGRATHAA
jgi:hypothetical protein